MPKISSYGTVTPSPSDRIIVSDADDSNATKNVTIGSLSSATAPKSYIDAYDLATSTTTVLVTDTWYKLNANFTLLIADGFAVHSNPTELINTSGTTLLSKIVTTITLNAGNNKTINAVLTNNTVQIPSSEQDVTTTGSGDDATITLVSIQNILPSSLLAIEVKNVTDTSDILCKHINYVVTSL